MWKFLQEQVCQNVINVYISEDDSEIKACITVGENIFLAGKIWIIKPILRNF